MSCPGSPLTLKRFFDRVVRRSFGDLAVRDDPAADYLLDLLTRFARTDTLHPPSAFSPQRVESVALLLLEIQQVWDVDSPGFNPVRERVEHLSVTGYYIREGKRAYHFVSEHDRADARPQAWLFRALADRFEGYAGVLTYVRKVYFRPEHAPPALPFFRQLITAW